MYGHCSSLGLVDDEAMVGPVLRAAVVDAHMRDGREEPRGHIIFTTSGLISVTTANGSWVLPPQRVLWVPEGVEHEASSRTPGAVRSLALAGDEEAGLPSVVCLFDASPLLRELLIEGERLAGQSPRSPRGDCVLALILSEIRERPAGLACVAAPSDARLIKLCEAILADPSNNRTIDEWARIVGMSRRALTRNFRAETRMSFATWRQQVRLQEATARLKMGQSVTRVAYEVGYESVSTFSTIFRQNFGTSPSRYARLDA